MLNIFVSEYFHCFYFQPKSLSFHNNVFRALLTLRKIYFSAHTPILINNNYRFSKAWSASDILICMTNFFPNFVLGLRRHQFFSDYALKFTIIINS